MPRRPAAAQSQAGLKSGPDVFLEEMISPGQGQQAQGRNHAGSSRKVTVAATATSLTAYDPRRNVFFRIHIHMYMCSFTHTAPVGIDQHASSQRSALYTLFIYPFQSYRAAQLPGLSSGPISPLEDLTGQ